MPPEIVLIVGILSYCNVIGFNLLANQRVGVGLECVKVTQRIRCWEFSYQGGIALFKVPEVMQIPVRQNDKSGILCVGVFAGLFLADKRVKLLRFCFQNGYRKTAGVQK